MSKIAMNKEYIVYLFLEYYRKNYSNNIMDEATITDTLEGDEGYIEVTCNNNLSLSFFEATNNKKASIEIEVVSNYNTEVIEQLLVNATGLKVVDKLLNAWEFKGKHCHMFWLQ